MQLCLWAECKLTNMSKENEEYEKTISRKLENGKACHIEAKICFNGLS